MLRELGLADAYGIGFEFVPADGDTRLNSGATFYQHPKYDTLKPGQYTDDTQRSIANALVVLEGDPLSIQSYADSYVDVFRADPRDGYSRNFQKLIESCKTGSDLIDKVVPTADSNGSIMGVLPLGYLPTPGLVRAAAAAQAMTTHSYATVPYAQDLALRAHNLIYGPRRVEGSLFNYAGTKITSRAAWQNNKEIMPTREPGPVKMSAHDTWCAVIELQQINSLRKIMRAAVNMRGDTDSVAALAVGLASLDPQVQNDIPQSLIDKFENGPFFGLDYLGTLDERLRAKFGLDQST